MADVTDADREAARTWANNRVRDGLLPATPVAAAAHGYEFGLAAGRAGAAEAEREACAKIAEQWDGGFYFYDEKGKKMVLQDAVQIAAAIRARTAKPGA